MAIFQKAYRGYSGTLTSNIERTLVIFRYALADAFKSRVFVAFFISSLLLPIILMCALYLFHNLELLLTFDIPLGDLPVVDGNFFAIAMQMPQNIFLFFLVVALGPTMISPDLRNNAMPLYLSRPINKSNYIIGKLMVLLVLGSIMSWVPAMFLYGLQGYLAGDGWIFTYSHLPLASFIISMTWLICLSLVAFTVSSFVKWKTVARIAFFGVFFVASIVGAIIEEVFNSTGSYLVDLYAGVEVLMAVLFDARNNQVLDFNPQMSPETAAMQIFIVSMVSLIILYRRISAYQAVS